MTDKMQQSTTHGGIMITKKVVIGIACCALTAPLAFGQGSQTATVEQELTVTGKGVVTTVETCRAASYQPAKTLVVQNDSTGRYVLDGPGHVFNSKGERVLTAIRPGARVQVYFANNGSGRTIDHVVVD
jgi:hypothetical protein